jgi:hypothetical protein
VVVGPVVLIVRVVVATWPSVMVTVAGLNEQIGEGSTAGVIELQPGVTIPVYPSVEVISRMAVAPLPAGTLLGEMVVSTVIEYKPAALSTVMWMGGAVCVRAPETPVTVIVYSTGGVRLVVAKVSEGEDGGVELAGLTAHVGPFAASTGVMAQESETGLLNPLSDPKVMIALESTSRSTLAGLGGETCKEKSACPTAQGTAARASIPRNKMQRLMRIEYGNFNMSRVQFN